MSPGCPSDLALEGYLLDPSGSKVGKHVEACGGCKGRVATMEREGQEFRQFVFPATVDKVAEAAGRRRRPWWLQAVILAPVAAGALLVALWPAEPPSDYIGTKGRGGANPAYVGTKGPPVGFGVFLGAAEGARAVASGEEVPASGALRFEVRPTEPCHLWVISVDGGGAVSRLYPSTGEKPALVSNPGALPGGAMLDGKAGPERLYAVCSPAPIGFADLEKAATSAVAGGGAAKVREAGDLPSLPAGTSQATLLVEKKP